jgi:stearoyl-CoA desaturase (delta-9 desaturase)
VSPAQYRAYLLVTALAPPAAVVLVLTVLWRSSATPLNLALLVVFYAATLFGLTVGYHRLFAHRSFNTRPWVRTTLAFLGALGAEGPPITWVAHHRRHHTFADEEGDPHSPHAHGHGGEGVRATLRGLWHAHMGWLFDLSLTSEPLRYAPDLVREAPMRWITRHFMAIAAAGVIAPGLIALAVTQTLEGFLGGVLWGGLVRIFLAHHVTYSVASIGHSFGARAYDTPDESRNVAWLALPSFGDSWHNNHHAFPRSARHGLRWWQVDLAGASIALMRRCGLAWDVTEPDTERPRVRGRVAAGDPTGVS